MIRRPPRSTLFPTRRSSDLSCGLTTRQCCALSTTRRTRSRSQRRRSEEHTSELQSHSDLVCRLLLEKKKEADVDGLVVDVGGEDAQIGLVVQVMPQDYGDRQ